MSNQASYGAVGNSSSQSQAASKPAAPPASASKVEPKVFLASERTFFSWLRVSLLLGSFGLALFNGGDKIGKYMGAVYALISVLAILYSLAMFQRRSYRIRSAYAGHFDELYGPVIVCVLLFAAVLANFVIRVKYHNGKLKQPKSPWLASYMSMFVDFQQPQMQQLPFLGDVASY